ncbi:XkdQ/YqbQ family protein [Longirhabdus pacifica]|uniref:XkdQ/YqbQ family protein n=1 Tax=Longirhabdus pacifica TaxID=2305227 RepID=UPI001008A156|nr:hypothetical protein [Longirhabdus pacifica]
MNLQIAYNGDFYIDPIVTSVTWSGDIKQAFRKLELSISNTENGDNPIITFEKGKPLVLSKDDKELFRGVIFSHSMELDGTMKLTAYDENIYLTKNMDTKKFVNMTASEIIGQLCSEYDILVGSIQDTGYVLPKLILRDKTLWDMMITALTETKKQTGRRFFIYSEQGKLFVKERKERVVEWVLQNGFNILGASYSESIEDLRNQVKVYSGDINKGPYDEEIEHDDQSIEKYGLMQHLETASNDQKQSQLKQLAKQLLKDLNKVSEEASIEALGHDGVISGTSVDVTEAMTGMKGAYYVVTDSHTFENNMHRMQVTLSEKEELPTLEYTEQE